jgi:uncharacterized protein (TIGR02271 family)
VTYGFSTPPSTVTAVSEDPVGSSGAVRREAVLQRHAEEAVIRTRPTPGQTVRVVTETHAREHVVEVPLTREIIDVEHVAIGQVVDVAPAIRYEGDVTILPVMEEIEVVVIQRRLILKEEIHVRRRRITETHQETISLRTQTAVVTRCVSDEAVSTMSLADLRRGAEINNQTINRRELTMSETIAAVYKTQAQADSAVQDLVAAGVSRSSIDRHMQGGSYLGDSTSLETRPTESRGFWASLFGGETHDDTRVYDENLTSGGSVVTVRAVSDADYDHVAAILDRHDPLDVDDHLARNSGLETTTTAYGTAPVVGQPVASGVAPEDATLSLSEESLAVGKRLVNRGSTRIRRYVIEKPVEENVTLRDEKVTIERRPVTAGSVVPEAAFTDKVIEMTETGEEAVVGKTARVVEEVALRKQAVDHVETVRDTVRKEEVEIEEVQGDGLATERLNNPVPRT